MNDSRNCEGTEKLKNKNTVSGVWCCETETPARYFISVR